MREHAEETILVEKAIQDFVVARGIVQDVPEAVIQILQGLLKVLGNLTCIVHTLVSARRVELAGVTC